MMHAVVSLQRDGRKFIVEFTDNCVFVGDFATDLGINISLCGTWNSANIAS